MTKEKLENIFRKDSNLSKYKNSAECKLYDTQNELFLDQKYLVSNGFTRIVCVYVDKHGKIEEIKAIKDLSRDAPSNNQDSRKDISILYIIFPKGNVRLEHLGKHKGKKLNVMELANTVDQAITLCRHQQ